MINNKFIFAYLLFVLVIIFSIKIQAQEIIIFFGETSANDSVPRFQFVDVTEAGFNTYQEGWAEFTRADSSFTVYAAGDSFKIGVLGTYDVAMETASSGDTVYAPITASANCSSTVSTTVTAGGFSDTYSVTTTTDNTPDAFAFDDVVDAEVSTEYMDTVVISGLECTAYVAVGGFPVDGEIRVNALGSWGTSSRPIVNGDTLYARITTSEFCETHHTTQVIVNEIGYTTIWTVTTKQDAPDAFAFTDITGAELETFYYDSVKIEGLECDADLLFGSPTGMQEPENPKYKFSANSIWYIAPPTQLDNAVSDGDTL